MKLREIMKQIVKPEGPYTQDQAEKLLGIKQWKLSNFKNASDEYEKNWLDFLKLLDGATALGIDCYDNVDLRKLNEDEMLVYLRLQLEQNLERRLYRPKAEIIRILERHVQHETTPTKVSEVESASKVSPFKNSARKIPQRHPRSAKPHGRNRKKSDS